MKDNFKRLKNSHAKKIFGISVANHNNYGKFWSKKSGYISQALVLSGNKNFSLQYKQHDFFFYILAIEVNTTIVNKNIV